MKLKNSENATKTIRCGETKRTGFLKNPSAEDVSVFCVLTAGGTLLTVATTGPLSSPVIDPGAVT